MHVILSTLIYLLTLRLRKRSSLELEVIALRHQLSILRRKKGKQPALILPADRYIWCWLYRTYPRAIKWMQIVKPHTVRNWHSRCFFFYWRARSQRAFVPRKVKGELLRLILQMHNENTGWGAARIQGELQKLGYKIGKRTVQEWLARFPPRPPGPSWRAFLRAHMHDTAAIDMFVVVTMSFRLLYAMIIVSLDRRKILHFGTTEHPTQEWLAGEVLRAFAKNPRPSYLIRDRDRCYGRKFSEQVRQLGIRERVTAPQSPSQNTYVERTIWSIRRECLNHILVMSERHLRRILASYVDYYNHSRVHQALDLDCPVPRASQRISDGKVIATPQVRGLHHRYERRAP
jgi:Integrase core domain